MPEFFGVQRLARIVSAVMFMLILGGMGPMPATAADQIIDLSSSPSSPGVGDNFTVTAEYDVSDGDNTLTGIELQFHYDDSQVSFDGCSGIFQDGGLFLPAECNESTGVVSISWFAPAGQWPGSSLPVDLVTLHFTMDSAGSTSISVTGSPAGGYGFVGDSLDYTVCGALSIDSFSATPGAICNGAGSSTLSWTTTGATSLSINQDVGDVTGSTSTGVSPAGTTTYTLTAENDCGDTETETVTVTVNNPPTNADISASSTSVCSGGSTILSWSATNATSYTVSNGSTDIYTGTGTQTPVSNITSETTFTLTATNASCDDSDTDSVTVTVGGSAPNITSFAPDDNPICSDGSNSSTFLRWTATDADSYTVEDGDGNPVYSGPLTSVSVSPDTDTDYTLTAIGGCSPNDTATTSVTVNAVPVITDFEITSSKTVCVSSNDVTLSWSATNATNYTVKDGSNATVYSGAGTSTTVNPTATTTYTLTASNGSGCEDDTEQSETVTVIPGPPVINDFSASDTTICADDSTTLSWDVTGENVTVTIDPDISCSIFGQVDQTGSCAAWPTETTTYTIRATNLCSPVGVTETVTINVDPLPEITSFTADPEDINSGDETTLEWTATNATSYTVKDGQNNTIYSGSETQVEEVKPGSTTIYTLTATNDCDESDPKSVKVSVDCPHPNITFTADSTSINLGEKTTLRWTVTGADPGPGNIVIDNGIGNVDASGEAEVGPGVETTYKLTAKNGCGPRTATVTVKVGCPVPVIEAFTATPNSVTRGDRVTLSWTVTGADTISIDNGVGEVVENSTTFNVTPEETTLYKLTATNDCGSSVRTVLVEVDCPPPVINSFSADPDAITPGDAAELTWSVTNADTVTISNGVGAVNRFGGNVSVTPAVTTSYTLTAESVCGKVSSTVTVSVDCPVPLIESFIATPPAINTGDSATLSWTVTNADSVEIDNGIGVVTNGSGTRQVTPDTTTTYTLSAINGCGVATESVTVSLDCPKPVIESFTAAPSDISEGDSITLSWAVTGADTVEIDNGIGAVKNGSGTRKVTPDGTTIYTLTATNECGGVIDAISVNVTGNLPPDAPELVSPAGGAMDVSLMPELTTGDFSDPDEDSEHAYTRWQVSTDMSDFSEGFLVIDEISSVYLTNWTIPSGLILEKSTVYFWRAMFHDGTAWSEPSDIYSFVTGSDGPDFTDGVDTSDVIGNNETMQLPADFIDVSGNPVNTATIKSFKSKVDPGVQIGLKAQNCTIEKCGSVDPDDLAATGGTAPSLPFGLISFELSVPNAGDTATVTVYFSAPAPADMKWWKYDPNTGYYDYDASTTATVVTFSADRKSVTLELKDGGYGDLIVLPDARIIDPGGPVGEASSSGGGGGGGCFVRSMLF